MSIEIKRPPHCYLSGTAWFPAWGWPQFKSRPNGWDFRLFMFKLWYRGDSHGKPKTRGRFMVSEWILSRFSHYVPVPYGGVSEHEPLKVLLREYPDLAQIVTGKRVLDFGCGQGNQCALMSKTYGAKVTGVDNDPKIVAWAIDTNGGSAKFQLKTEPTESFDVVISQNSMEHFVDAKGVLQQMTRALAPDGLMLITFGPPWYAPYGSHMHFFCRIPWLNLLFPEKAVMGVRARYVQDGAQRYTEVTGGLSKMSLRKFEQLIRESGLTIERRKYTGVKGLNFLTHIPILRELLTVHVTVMLKRDRQWRSY